MSWNGQSHLTSSSTSEYNNHFSTLIVVTNVLMYSSYSLNQTIRIQYCTSLLECMPTYDWLVFSSFCNLYFVLLWTPLSNGSVSFTRLRSISVLAGLSSHVDLWTTTEQCTFKWLHNFIFFKYFLLYYFIKTLIFILCFKDMRIIKSKSKRSFFFKKGK